MTTLTGYSAVPETQARVWRQSVPLAWCVSRVVMAAGLVLGAWWHGRRAVSGGFTAWDGRWYLRAALRGYGGAPIVGHRTPWPFFPLLPGMLRLLHLLGLPAAALVIVGNHLLVFVALVGVWQLAHRHAGPDNATRAVWILAAFPMSGVFSMLYPSAIFLAASVWAFELADRRQWPACGLVAMLATLARPNGVVTALVLVAVALVRHTGTRRWSTALVAGGPSAVAFGSWMVVCAVKTGNPIVFVTAKSAWKEQTALEIGRRLVGGTSLDSALVHVVLGAIAAAGLVAAWGRLPRSWRGLGVITLAVPLVTGVVGLGRYVNECFPLVIAGGMAMAAVPRWTRHLALVLSLSTGFVLAAVMAAHGLVP